MPFPQIMQQITAYQGKTRARRHGRCPGSVGLAAGTYSVGLCGTAPNVNAPWNNNGQGFTTALALR